MLRMCLKTGLVCLFVCSHVSGQEIRHHPIMHYIRTHKLLLATDIVDLGGWTAESYTSVVCLNDMKRAHAVSSTCAKQGWFGLSIAPGFIVANHLMWHFAPDRESRYVAVAISGFTTGVNARFTYQNVFNSSVPFLNRGWGTEPLTRVRLNSQIGEPSWSSLRP